jgi:hypothetical protein
VCTYRPTSKLLAWEPCFSRGYTRRSKAKQKHTTMRKQTQITQIRHEPCFVLCTLCCQFLWILFVLLCFVLCTLWCQKTRILSFEHFLVCPSIDGFWLPLWYLQNFLVKLVSGPIWYLNNKWLFENTKGKSKMDISILVFLGGIFHVNYFINITIIIYNFFVLTLATEYFHNSFIAIYKWIYPTPITHMVSVYLLDKFTYKIWHKYKIIYY